MKKRIFSMLLAVVMLFGTVVLPATAEDAGTTQAPASTVDTSIPEVATITKEQATALTKTLYSTSGTVKGPIDANNGCWLMVVQNTTYTEYTAYKKALLDKGFETMVAEHEVLGTTNCPKSAIYANDQYVINTFRTTAGDKNTYVTIEPIADMGTQGDYLDVFKAPTTVDRVCEPMLIQIGVDDNTAGSLQDTERSGMSYVLRTADGRFIVYDGGFGNDSLKNPDKLYNVMKKNAPTSGPYANQVVIATWLITHPHMDHIDAFRAFVTRYIGYEGAPVVLQSVIADFPSCSDTEGEKAIVAYGADIDSNKVATYDRYLMGLQHDGVDVYKAHTGQKYYFNDVSLEILYTAQLAYPVQIGSSGADGTNSLSIVSRVFWDGASYDYAAMFTGDATGFVITKLNKLYGTNMNSANFVQVPHHGNVDSYGSSTEMEELNTFYNTNVQAYRYLIPTGVRHGEVVQGRVAVADRVYEDEKRLIEYALAHSNNPMLNLPAARTFVAGSSVTAFTMSTSENKITKIQTAGATYWATSPTLAETTVAIKDGSKATYIYNRVGLMTLDRKTNYILKDNLTVPIIPGVTQFPICGEFYHSNFNGNKKTITLTSNGTVNLELSKTTGLLFESVGMVVYKYNDNANSKIAAEWSSSLGTISSVEEKTDAWIKNLTVECPDVTLTGSTSAQFSIFAGYTWGSVEIANVAIRSGTITKNTTASANIGAILGKARNGVTLTNCSFNGSILYGSSAEGDSRVGGLIGVVELLENNLKDLPEEKRATLDDKLNWELKLSNCKVNTSNTTGTIQGYNFAGGLIGSLQASNSELLSLTVNGCTVDGAVEAINGTSSKAGGLLGTVKENATITVDNFANKADVSAFIAGGTIGYMETASTLSVTNSSNAGTITATNGSTTHNTDAAGGVIGTVAATATVTISDFSNSGSIATAKAGTASISAVIGQTAASTASTVSVTNAVNSGTIATNARQAGALAGSLASGTQATFYGCINRVSDLRGEGAFDGLIGEGTATLRECWDLGAAGITYQPSVPLSDSFAVLKGARLRVSSKENAQQDSGIRFDIAVDEAMLAAYHNAGYTVTLGSLMVKTTSLGSLEFTEDALKAANVKYTKTEMEYTAMKESGKLRANRLGNYFYTASLINLPDTAYAIEFSCIGYIVLEKDGQSLVLYSGFNLADNSRSAQYVATAVLASPNVETNYKNYMDILKTFAGVQEEEDRPLEKENANDQMHDASTLK